MAKGGITSDGGIKQIQKSLMATAGWLSGVPAAKVQTIQKIVGSELWQETVKAVMNHYGRAGPLSRSYGFAPIGRTFVSLFTDLRIAPHGAMREKGGSIRATSASKFRSKDGRPQLVFKIGGDWIRTSATIYQTGDYWMKYAIRDVIHDKPGHRGYPLSSVLGVSLKKMLTFKGAVN